MSSVTDLSSREIGEWRGGLTARRRSSAVRTEKNGAKATTGHLAC